MKKKHMCDIHLAAYYKEKRELERYRKIVKKRLKLNKIINQHITAFINSDKGQEWVDYLFNQAEEGTEYYRFSRFSPHLAEFTLIAIVSPENVISPEDGTKKAVKTVSLDWRYVTKKGVVRSSLH